MKVGNIPFVRGPIGPPPKGGGTVAGQNKDNVNRPSHYTSGKIECIEAIEVATEGLEGIEAVCTGNVLKYIWRWKRKNGVEDLKKAQWYLNKLIETVGEKNGRWMS